MKTLKENATVVKYYLIEPKLHQVGHYDEFDFIKEEDFIQERDVAEGWEALEKNFSSQADADLFLVLRMAWGSLMNPGLIGNQKLERTIKAVVKQMNKLLLPTK
jgi:hypothetical protein